MKTRGTYRTGRLVKALVAAFTVLPLGYALGLAGLAGAAAVRAPSPLSEAPFEFPTERGDVEVEVAVTSTRRDDPALRLDLRLISTPGMTGAAAARARAELPAIAGRAAWSPAVPLFLSKRSFLI